MKVLLTGGHFSPALSVIQTLQKDGHEVVIVGRKHPFEGDNQTLSYEYRVSQELHIPFVELKTGRLQRKITRQTLPALVRSVHGMLNAHKIVAEVNPDVVLTFGGYLALPIALDARLRNIPLVTHEQTQKLGLANSLIAKIADAICVTFPSTKKQLKSRKVVLTGNPLRADIFTVTDTFELPKGFPVLYVTGGSTGSHPINAAIRNVLPELLEKFVVIHQTGESSFHDFETLDEFKKSLPDTLKSRYSLHKYIYPSQIGFVYKSADIVIGRSGANTILELLALNKPSILIPLPHGQSGEQLENARLLEQLGLAEVVMQDDAERVLLPTLEKVQEGLAKYHLESGIIEQYIFRDAARRIVDVLVAHYEKKKKKDQ